MSMGLVEIKDQYRIPCPWRDFALPGEPAKICRSPFPAEHTHGDLNPSFSVFDNGRRWRNFATGEGGDVFDFIAKFRGCSTADAIQVVREKLGLRRQPSAPRPPVTPAKVPEVRCPTEFELGELTNRRGFSLAGLKVACERGFSSRAGFGSVPRGALRIRAGLCLNSAAWMANSGPRMVSCRAGNVIRWARARVGQSALSNRNSTTRSRSLRVVRIFWPLSIFWSQNASWM